MAESKENTNELFKRLATSLELGKVPTVEDSVALELLVIQYWEKEDEPINLGLMKRVTNRKADVSKLNKVSVQTIINHFVQQKMPEDAEVFAVLLRCYLGGEITASDLFGERHRKPRNGQRWQYKDRLGEQAELVRICIATSDIHMLTGKRSLSDNSNRNLYDLLSELSDPCAQIKKIKEKYGLPPGCDVSLIDLGFQSPKTWLDRHKEFKEHS